MTPFDAGSVVPRTDRTARSPRGGKVVDVALEVPLGGLALRWLLEGDHRRFGVQVLHMKRLIVPPLPAAPLPSNRTTTRAPDSSTQFWSWSSSICKSRLRRS